MAFTVEDGTGLAAANSYVDVAFADAHFDQKGIAEWTALSPTEKQNALMNGSEYIDLKYGRKLRGYPLVVEQALEFPRADLVDRYERSVTGVPADIQRAACEYGWLRHNNRLYPATLNNTVGAVKKKLVKAGPITTSTEYMDSQPVTTNLKHPYPDGLMKQYLKSGGGGVIRN